MNTLGDLSYQGFNRGAPLWCSRRGPVEILLLYSYCIPVESSLSVESSLNVESSLSLHSRRALPVRAGTTRVPAVCGFGARLLDIGATFVTSARTTRKSLLRVAAKQVRVIGDQPSRLARAKLSVGGRKYSTLLCETACNNQGELEAYCVGSLGRASSRNKTCFNQTPHMDLQET